MLYLRKGWKAALALHCMHECEKCSGPHMLSYNHHILNYSTLKINKLDTFSFFLCSHLELYFRSFVIEKKPKISSILKVFGIWRILTVRLFDIFLT